MFFSLHSMTCNISSLVVYVLKRFCPTENRRGFCPGGFCPGDFVQGAFVLDSLFGYYLQQSTRTSRKLEQKRLKTKLNVTSRYRQLPIVRTVPRPHPRCIYQ